MRCLCEYNERLTPFSFSSFFKDCWKNYLIKEEERFPVCTIGKFTKRDWSFPCILTDERMITLFSFSSLAIGNAQKRDQRTAIGRSADCKAVRLLCVFSNHLETSKIRRKINRIIKGGFAYILARNLPNSFGGTILCYQQFFLQL